VALVTGAALRIGRVIALELAGHGFDVAIHTRQDPEAAEDTAAQARALGAAATVFAADLSQEAACRALLPAVVAGMGRVDALVNNASVFQYDDAASAAPAAMDWHWRVNTAAPVLLAQALATQVAAQGGTGCVVNLLDQKLWNPNPDHFSYTLSKAALREATVLLAQALAPAVRVVGVAPGVTLPSGPMTEREFAAAHRLTPLQRS
jgi:NAD(P)-dependent dehydrogenase (short-subunit alcohol dehydrogenase family)